MMMSKIVLDLYCGAGGASVGIANAGFEVRGVDIQDQPNYPFRIYKADCLEVLEALATHGKWDDILVEDIAWIWASPPCQAASWAARRWKKQNKYPDLIPATRDQLFKIELKYNVPYVIENVIGAALHKPIKLTGPMFDLGVIRPRIFESNLILTAPPKVKAKGTVRDGTYVTVAGHGGDGSANYQKWCDAMDIHWMNKRPKHNGTKANPGNKNDLAESIPPAYSRHIAYQIKKFTS